MLKRTNGLGGFTLAEVLITLGIIGVVAAMTMPTLINSTQGAQYKTAFKKSLTVLSQAVVMNIALNDYDLSQVVDGTNATADADASGAQSLYDLFHNRLNIVREASAANFSAEDEDVGNANFYKIVSDGNAEERTSFAGSGSGGGDDDDDTGATGGHGSTNAATFTGDLEGATWPAATTLLFMNDGITFIFDNTQSNCQKADLGIGVTEDNYCYGFIDVNGQKAPNRVVQCDNGQTPDGSDDYACTVSSPTDIYPIAMYDQSVIPASAAARAVLYNK